MPALLAPDVEARLLTSSRHLLLDLRRRDPWRYWLEFALHTAAGWSALACAVMADLDPLGLAAAVAVAALAMFRAVVFLHELVHLPGRALPGLRAAWVLAWGLPFFLPPWLYERAHLEHHRRAVYGTPQDPEYVPVVLLGQRSILLSYVLGHLVPLALVARFLVASPLGWASPGLRRAIDARFSSLAPNAGWRAPTPEPGLRRAMRRSEAACFVWGWGLVTLVALERLPPRALGVPLAVMMGTMALNQLRAHTAHRCLHPGVPSDEAAMVRDAVNVEARGLTRLCFPLGIELHALHHLEPAIPFHHLAEAHRRLTAALPPESVYRQASEPGLWASLRRLYDSAAPPARG